MSNEPDQRIVDSLVASLRENREQQGLSMYRVAQISGLDERTISKVESGKINPTLLTILRIARAQGIKVGSLLSQFEEP